MERGRGEGESVNWNCCGVCLCVCVGGGRSDVSWLIRLLSRWELSWCGGEDALFFFPFLLSEASVSRGGKKNQRGRASVRANKQLLAPIKFQSDSIPDITHAELSVSYITTSSHIHVRRCPMSKTVWVFSLSISVLQWGRNTVNSIAS